MASGLAVQAWLSLAKPFGRTPLARHSRVRPTPAPSWAMVAAFIAPILDIPLGQLIGDPAPALTLTTLIVVLVARGRRFRAQRAATEASVTSAAGTPYRVVSSEIVATGVKRLLLTPESGEVPAWSPGAHVDLVLASDLVRQYSLAGDPEDRICLEVAVLIEPEGRGGSVEMHALRAGDTVTVAGPRNHFPLVDAPGYLFVAGGIGITPFLPMIREADRLGRPWRLVYRGARLADMAYAADLTDHYPDRVQLLPADECPRPDLSELLAQQPAGTAAYCCGPEAMLDAFEKAGTENRHVDVHVERFTPLDLTDLPSEPFDVTLAFSRRTVHVPGGTTMLDALRPALPDLPASCETGVCGTCVLSVLAGTPDHRDAILNGADRERTDIIYPCVSRCRDQRIILDA